MALYRRNPGQQVDERYADLLALDVQNDVAPQDPTFSPDEIAAAQDLAELKTLERSSQTERAFNQGVTNVKASGIGLRGLARGAFGDEAGATRDLTRSAAMSEQAAAEGPDVQNLSDINGVGDAFAYARNLGVSQLPNLALTAATGGSGGLARIAAQRAVRGAVARGVASRVATSQGLKSVPRSLARTAQRRVGALAPDDAAGRAFQQGVGLGAAAGGTTLQAGQTAEGVLDPEGEGSVTERSRKALAGAALTGSIEALPVMALFRRFGLGEADKVAKAAVSGPLFSRVAKQAAKQGMAESATEVAQTVGEVATHKWINENVDLVGPEAMNQYVNAAVGGAVGGAMFGAPAGLRGVSDQNKRTQIRDRMRDASKRLAEKLAPKAAPSGAPAAAATAEPTTDFGAKVKAAVSGMTGAATGAASAARGAAGTAASGLSAKYQSKLDELRKNGWFDNSLDAEFEADPFDFTVDPGTQIGSVSGTPMKGFIDTERFGQLQAAGMSPTAARWASPIEDSALATDLEARGAFTTVNRAFRGDDVGKFSDDEKAHVRDYLAALEPQQADRFRRWLTTADKMADLGALERGDKGEVTFASIAQEPEDTTEIGAAKELDATDLAPEVLRRGRGRLVTGNSMPKDAFVAVDAAGNRRSINVANMLKVLDKDQDTQELTKGMAPADRQAAKVVNALAMLEQQGMKIEPASIRAIALDKNGERWITADVARRIAAGYKPMRPTQTFATIQDVRAANPELGRATGAGDTGQADPADMVGVTGLEGQPEAPVTLAPVRAGQGSPTLGDMNAPALDAATVDTKAKKAERGPSESQELDSLLERYTGEKPQDWEDRRDMYARVLREGRRDFTNVKSRINPATGQLERAGKPVQKKLGPNERAELREAAENFAEAGLMRAIRAEKEALATWQKNKSPATKQALDKSRRALAIAEDQVAAIVDRSAARREQRNSPERAPKRTRAVRKAVREAPENVQEGLAELSSLLEQEFSPEGYLSAIDEGPAGLPQVAAFDAGIAKAMESKAGVEQLIAEIKQLRSRRGLSILINTVADHHTNKNGYSEVLAAAFTQLDSVKADLKTAAQAEASHRTMRTSPVQATAAFVAMDGSTNLADALDNVRPLANAAQKRLIDTLLQMSAIKGIKFALRPKTSNGFVSGQHSEGVDTVFIDRPSVLPEQGGDPIQTLLHEAIHGATVKAERANPALRRDINRLVNHARAQMKARGLDPSIWYGMADTQEFLAEAFTNPDLQALLASMPAADTATFKNLWDQFKGFVAQLLGLAPADANLLDEVFVVGLEMARQNAELRVGAMSDMYSGADNSVDMATQPAAWAGQLDPRSRAELITVFQRPDVRNEIVKKMPPALREQAMSADRGPALLVSYGVGLSLQGNLSVKVGPVRQLWMMISKALQIPSADVYADQIIADLRTGKYDAKYDVRKQVLSKQALVVHDIMEKRVQPISDALLKNIDTRIRAAGVPALIELATMFSQRTGEVRSDKARAYRLRTQQERSQRLNDLSKIIGNIDPKDARVLVRSLQKGGAANTTIDDAQWKRFANKLRLKKKEFDDPDVRRFVELSRINGAAEKHSDPANWTPAQKAAYNRGDYATFSKLRGYTDAEIADFNEWMSLIPKLDGKYGVANDETASFTESISYGVDEFLPHLPRTGLPAKYAHLQPMFEGLRGYLEDMHDYMTKAGLEFGKIENYFPVAIDSVRVTEREDALRELLSAPNFAKSVAKAGGVEKLIRSAKGSDEAQVGDLTFADGDHDPGFRPLNKRLSAFIYKEGTPEQIRAFTQFQSTDLEKILTGYTVRAVRRAEWERMKLGPRIKKLMAKARKEGATNQQMTMAQDYVDQMMGTYHNEWNPIVKRVLESVDRVFASDLASTDFEKFKSVQQALIAYQNVRLLGLAAVSSIIDPLATIVRSGSMGGSFSNMREALRAYRDAEGNDALRAMAEHLGVVERTAMNEQLAHMYGATIDPKALSTKANTLLFKYNGLETITRYTRLMALAAGHRFLIKHAGVGNKQSARYLRELGLDKTDIQVVNGFVVLNPKTEAALVRFVDEAVVRPKAEQRPSWHNDPNFALAAQYKSYLYAFSETVLERAKLELANSNYAVLAPLALYLPVTALAEMARDGLQGDDDDREMSDYAKLSLDRSGLMGPRLGVITDVGTNIKYGSGVLGTIAGPTGQQLGDAYDVLAGTKGIGGASLESLPGHTLYEDWQLWTTDSPGGVRRPAPTP